MHHCVAHDQCKKLYSVVHSRLTYVDHFVVASRRLWLTHSVAHERQEIVALSVPVSAIRNLILRIGLGRIFLIGLVLDLLHFVFSFKRLKTKLTGAWVILWSNRGHLFFFFFLTIIKFITTPLKIIFRNGFRQQQNVSVLLFILGLLKHKFYRNNCRRQRDSIVGYLQGWKLDPTTAHLSNLTLKSYILLLELMTRCRLIRMPFGGAKVIQTSIMGRFWNR